MRSTSEALQAFEETVERYLLELDNLDMEQLLKKPNDEEWSIGQVYMHLIQSALYLHLHNVDQCLGGSDATVGVMEKKTERGIKAFELGSFPPDRIRVPASPQYTPKQPENKEQLAQRLHDVVEQMRRTESVLSQEPKSEKMVHPGLGALDAKEWFLLIEMHYRHHLLQLERLKLLWN